MYRQTLISTLVCVGVLCCCTPGVSAVMSERQKTQVAIKLDRLVRFPGWELLRDVVKILPNANGEEVADPVSQILGAVLSGRRAVDETNVLQRHGQIWTALMCKYGEIIFNYKCLMNHLIGVCQNEEWSTPQSFQRYSQCVRSVLIKLHTTADRLKCMTDALEYIFSLVPRPADSTPKAGVMVAAEILAGYTKTIGPTTSARLSQRWQRTPDRVDDEIKTIGEYISQVHDENVQPFTDDHCNVMPENRMWTAPTLVEDFERAVNVQRIPPDTTMLDYVKDEIDHYSNEILHKWFFGLGFGYGLDGVVEVSENYRRRFADFHIF